jgi:hypothetical protein
MFLKTSYRGNLRREHNIKQQSTGERHKNLYDVSSKQIHYTKCSQFIEEIIQCGLL